MFKSLWAFLSAIFERKVIEDCTDVCWFYQIWGEDEIFIARPKGKPSGNRPHGIVSVPDQVMLWGELYTVNYIADRAFSDCKELTEVHIPATVYIIDDTAFKGCNKLEAIYIENTNIEYKPLKLPKKVRVYVGDRLVQGPAV